MIFHLFPSCWRRKHPDTRNMDSSFLANDRNQKNIRILFRDRCFAFSGRRLFLFFLFCIYYVFVVLSYTRIFSVAFLLYKKNYKIEFFFYFFFFSSQIWEDKGIAFIVIYCKVFSSREIRVKITYFYLTLSQYFIVFPRNLGAFLVSWRSLTSRSS